MGAMLLRDWKAGAASPRQLVCFRYAWYSACKARRSALTLAMAAFEGEAPIPRLATPRSWIAGGPAPWAEMGGPVKPRIQVTAPSARRREGRKRVALQVLITNLLPCLSVMPYSCEADRVASTAPDKTTGRAFV